jgi:Amidohydrolase family
VPGFIDCHTHLVAHDFVGDDFLASVRSMRVLSAVPVLTTLLRSGVTTVAGTDLGVDDLASRIRRVWHDGTAVRQTTDVTSG